jgi:hypothetical protein
MSSGSGSVPVLAALLLEWRRQSPYPKGDDWVFPSLKLKGAKPRSASLAAQDYLCPAAVYAGFIDAGSSKRVGWRNLSHPLSGFLAGQVDPLVNYEDASAQTPLHNRGEIHSPRDAAAGRSGPFLKAISKTERRTKRKRREKSDHGLDRGLKLY